MSRRLNILLIEDDDVKRGRLTDFLREAYPEIIISDARSMQSGLRDLIRAKRDLVLLDMNLPTYDITPEESGGRIQQFAGREMLRQMQRRHILVPVIVVTQFDYFGEGKSKVTLAELDTELRQKFVDNYRGYISYHAPLDDWKRDLPKLIEKATGEA